MIVLPREWKEYWNIEKKGFEQLFNVKGPVYSENIGRKTLRFKFGEKYYFGKFHTGVGWKKIIKNILQFRSPPVLSAQNEWRAIKKLESIGVDTMRLVGYGKRGCNPAKIHSFVVTHELKNTVSLEKYCRNWASSPPSEAFKAALITEVAKIARTIHENGLNHRDLYICHYLLDISNGIKSIDPKKIHLYLIDLHRVQIRPRTPLRWRAKDISALLFSSMDIGLTKKDLLLFAGIYHNTTPTKSINENKFFWWLVKRRAINLYKKEFKKEPPPIL
ncbi:heptose I phosphotransferase [Desulfocicer vacuolatum DSM 3385]|uniref:Heptose I phosphotransferase n=1 Tax=Desulfocicer vacuolatum DSM 3385 TaxID=1121400 RepID=A0A1W1Z9F4_9BACT|nr:lipopolysaccharide core heptose(I) kinase RfaP [Desulfocicer vacuolatum]SMC44821.1 heptose I phosphotransferase [Desulfocicer vacuolatum DSM 3385]